MRCDDIRKLLDDHVDSTLGLEDRVQVTRHLESCDTCGAEARALRELVSELRAMPESIDPAADLWPAIDRRLDDEEEVEASAGRPARFWTAPARPSLWHGLLAATVLLAAFAGGYLIRPVLNPTPDRGVPVESRTPGTDTAMASREAALGEAEFSLLEVKKQLRRTLEERRDTLSPETVRMVDRNLAVIERSIEEIRTALREDPGNRELRNMLMAAHRREINLLRRANEVAARL